MNEQVLGKYNFFYIRKFWLSAYLLSVDSGYYYFYFKNKL
jgi:hypothetical protein